ncbi:MAG: HAD family phosphatase [Candidatus Micrarchaeota archaeon]|nr:HAD family phosphatase [Candidatus Micrarchaeota archaeon]
MKMFWRVVDIIKAIIFDFGGVLTRIGTFRVFIKLIQLKNLDEKETYKDLHSLWEMARVEKISSDEFWNEAGKILGMEKNKIRDLMINSFGFREEIIPLIKQLKENYKIALLTNQIRDWLEETMKKYNLNRLFDVVITSYETGISKPDRRIFDILLSRLNFDESECVLIDDQMKNIDMAKRIGMNAILFKSVEQLENDLHAMGILY